MLLFKELSLVDYAKMYPHEGILLFIAVRCLRMQVNPLSAEKRDIIRICGKESEPQLRITILL